MNPIIRFSWVFKKGGPSSAPSLVQFPVIAVQAPDENPDKGVTLVATPGVWEGVDDVTGQWYRSGVLLPGETGLTLVIANDTVSGDWFQYIETATNAVGAANGFSNEIHVDEPSVVNGPAIIESPPYTLGQTITGTTGNWTPWANSYAYQWLRNGVPISGQTISIYTLTSDDHQTQISVRVTATNSYGSTPADSDAQPVGFVPNVISAPVIGGWGNGNALTVTSPASWEFLGTTAGQWRRNGVDVAGQTSNTYSGPIASGDSILFRSTATNFVGSAFSDSNAISIGFVFDLEEEADLNYALSFAVLGDRHLSDLLEEADLNYALSFAVLGDRSIHDGLEEASLNYDISGALTDP